MSKGQTLQDPFLNSLRKERIPVSIFLVNGIKLQGHIESFDQYVVLLKNTVSQMVYKHAISTVVPARNPRPTGTPTVGAPQGNFGGQPTGFGGQGGFGGQPSGFGGQGGFGGQPGGFGNHQGGFAGQGGFGGQPGGFGGQGGFNGQPGNFGAAESTYGSSDGFDDDQPKYVPGVGDEDLN